ncbi:MAG: PBP1A family penicillin-binding protein [Myxococcota bacterium]|nr:PBP1A family penicillin-binding protein [Myxococcota bacterium]
MRLRSWGGALAVLALVAGFWTSSWILEQDRIVVGRFEGRRFSVPSKVLSATTILYPGLDWKRVELPETLERLGYRERSTPGDLAPGRYRWGQGELQVHLRAFEHPSRAEPARSVAIGLDRNHIASIHEISSGRELGAVLLEPQLVGAYYGLDREQRDLVRLDDLPRHLSDAVLAVEDQRFESHHGVDLRRIAGAFVANIRAGGIRQGASTLTQQLVKNFFLTPEQTLQRKFTEAVMALLVEARYDKEAILETYLNEIYLGQRGSTEIHGVGEAARFYFGKPASELVVAESALLAAIVQSPNRISPHRHADRARERRNLVLQLMHEQGRLTRAEYEQAAASPIRVASVTPEMGESRYFLDVLRRQLPEAYDRDLLAAEGLEIYSTLDPRMQRAGVRALLRGLDRIERARPEIESEDPGKRLQGCLISMRPQTGEVLALVGGRNYGLSQFDRCTQARRQAGSVFKPFAYLAALEKRGSQLPAITPATLLDDSPLALDLSGDVWEPRNYDREFRGLVSARYALEHSLNIPAIRLGLEIGSGRVADMARRLGVTSDLPQVASLPLGTATVSPFEIVRAYATIANGGTRPQPHTFEDVVARGETLERRELRFERVLDEGVAYLGISLLEGVVDRGTGSRVRGMGMRGPVAGKTGTTDDEHDLWFVGFTPELVTLVWVGYDEPRTIGVQSSWGALPIWVDFMTDVAGKRVRGAFLPPPSVREVEIHPESGALALDGCPKRVTESFLRGTEPTRVCTRKGASVEPLQGRQRESRGSGPTRGFWDWIFGR